MGTGSSGGNATDGNDIPSPRPFADDEDEIENYTEKNVGYGAMGSHTTGMEKNKGTFNRDPRGGMFELKNYIKKVLREQAYGHATLTTQGIPNQSRAIVGTDEYPFTARPKSRLPGVQEDTMSDEEWEDAKEAERLANHPERDKIRKAQQMIDKERGPSYDEVYLKGKLAPFGVYSEYNKDRGQLEIYPDVEDPMNKTRASQYIAFKLERGELHFTQAFGYERTYQELKKVFPQIPVPGSSMYSGFVNIMTDEGSIPVDIDTAKEMIQAMRKGLDAEASAQSAFYTRTPGRGGTGIDERTNQEIERDDLYHNKELAKNNYEKIENQEDEAEAAANQGRDQGRIAISQQEEQLYELNQKIATMRKEFVTMKAQYDEKSKIFQEMPAEPEFLEEKEALYEDIVNLRENIQTTFEEIKSLREQRTKLNQSKLDAISSQTSMETPDFSQQKRDAKKAITQVGKGGEGGEVAETLLRQYIKERTNINLMEQMDSYNETTRGSLEKFFKMFEAGGTNEEVIQHYAKNGIQIPEQFISKVKKQFEQYKKLKLELGFTEQEAKDFKKSVVPQEDTKKLSTRIFKK